MANAQQQLVIAQFGPRAAAYVESTVHAQGADLDHLVALLHDRSEARVLDLGCGGGHVSLKVAPLVRHVMAYDLAAPMLAAVERLACERGLANISTQQGTAEALPFADGSFDIVLSRYSAHHWTDLNAALRDARRVLAPNGLAVFMDVVAPETPVLDTCLQTMELLRDPSHVRDYSASEWPHALATAGFALGQKSTRKLRLDFASWIARIATPEPHAVAIRSLQKTMSEDVATYFAFEPDGSFTIDTATFEAIG